MNRAAPLRAWQTCTLLAAANLFWAGNWVVGRALRDVFDPLTLNFSRWLLAAVILAPFALPLMKAQWPLLRRHAVLLLALSASGCALFQSMVYVGVRSTTSVNAVLLSSSAPLFVMLFAWVLERQAASARQVVGMLVALGGIGVILARGDPASLSQWEIHRGDAWILAAMPVWGLYSVLLRRLPAEMRGSALLFALSALAVPLLSAPMLAERWDATSSPPRPDAIAGLAYVALFASVLAFACWNRAVAAIGPSAAGFSLPLMPLFGTLLAILFLDEDVQAYHGVGIATILLGVALATWVRKSHRAHASVQGPLSAAQARGRSWPTAGFTRRCRKWTLAGRPPRA